MALNKKDLVALMKTVAKADPTSPVTYAYNDEQFSYSVLDETLRRELNEYAGTYSLYRENKNFIFSVLEEVLDDVLPKKVADVYSSFAEIKTFNQGDKPLFRRKLSSKTRAKQFITRVGLAGIYEVFKMGGSESFEVPTSAIGGAAQIGFEEFLDGRVDFAEMLQIIMEGMDELITKEIGKALIASLGQLPAVNQHIHNGFNEECFDRLLMIADSYGTATIYCTFEFAAKMLPKEGWVSDSMKDQMWSNGRLGSYKGHNVVILPQSLEDETNAKKVIDPSYVWIIPSGGDTKPVKVAFEGSTIIDEYTNYDRSREVQVYKKVGVVAIMTNNICVYKDSSLSVDIAEINHES